MTASPHSISPRTLLRTAADGTFVLLWAAAGAAWATAPLAAVWFGGMAAAGGPPADRNWETAAGVAAWACGLGGAAFAAGGAASQTRDGQRRRHDRALTVGAPATATFGGACWALLAGAADVPWGGTWAEELTAFALAVPALAGLLTAAAGAWGRWVAPGGRPVRLQ